MSNNWDEDYNTSSMSADQLRELELKRQTERIIEERVLRGYIEIPALSEQEVRANFSTLFREERNPYHGDVFAPWNTNRLMWICHSCGAFGFKTSLRETFRCYHYSCHSRDVTVCRAGEVSLLIRGILDRQPGVNMIDVFETRRQRIKNKKNKIEVQDENTLSIL